MRLHELCEGIVAEVDGCLGCAVVDLATGLSLAMKVVPGTLLTDDAMEVMAAASVDYFRGRTVWQLELAMSEAGAEENPAGFVREIQTTTADTYHFMSVVPGREDALMILITDKTANLGLGWIAMRHALARLRELYEPERPSAAAATTSAVSAGDATWPQSAGEHQGAPAPAHQPAGAPPGPSMADAGDGASIAERAFPELRTAVEGQAPSRGDDPELFNPRWRGVRGARGRLTR